MFIIETKNFKKDYKKKLVDKHLTKEIEKLENLQKIIVNSNNFHDLIVSPYKIIYGIEQKKGNLKELFTAKLNKKLRLVIKPIGIFPYDLIEIDEIELINIDDKHYGEG